MTIAFEIADGGGVDAHGLWQQVLTELEVSLSRANFGMWFRDTFIVEDTGETITIGVPNTFYLDWIRGKYHKSIAETIRKFRPTVREINYKVTAKPTQASQASSSDLGPLALNLSDFSARPAIEQGAGLPTLSPAESALVANQPSNEPVVLEPIQNTPSAPEAPARSGQIPLDSSRNFESFIVGNSNRLAHAVSLAAAQDPGKKYNPLFIYGGVGLGKTHLAQAIGNEIKRTNPGFTITYVSCETFTNEFIDSLRKNQMESFKRRYRNTDVLLIDDIQFMSGKSGIQEEFFHTFNALHQTKRQIVLTADQEPQNIKGLEGRLTSRFAWGMVADIQPPDFETRVAILRTKCVTQGYQVPDEILQTLAQIIQSNIRELEGSLQHLITRSQIEQIPLTSEYVTRVFAGVAAATRSRGLNPERIIQIVSQFFELEPSEIIGSRRFKELVYPRQLAMYLLRHELSYSYPQIGKALGGKDHTTIMHGVEKIAKELARNTNIQYDLSQLKERLHQSG